MEFTIDTRRHEEFINLDHYLRDFIRKMGIDSGVITVFVPHTTAAVTINENGDPRVQRDILTHLEKMVPWQGDYLHGEGNSAAHIKSSLLGSSCQVPVENGRLLLGTWQSVYFCEFDGPRRRRFRLLHHT